MPREVEMGKASVVFDRSARVEPAGPVDPAALALLRDLISNAPAGNAGTLVVAGHRGMAGIDGHLAGVPVLPGAYRLHISPLGILPAGHDARSTCYAIRSLARIAAGQAALPEMTVTDWPEVASRGVVEGIYGTPWSHERRLSLYRFMGSVKLNTYLYGPKDDP